MSFEFDFQSYLSNIVFSVVNSIDHFITTLLEKNPERRNYSREKKFGRCVYTSAKRIFIQISR